MGTQHVERNFLLNLYREENISLVCFFLPLKRDKNVWHLQPSFSTWRPLAFLPVTLSDLEIVIQVKQVRDSEISYGITYVKNLMNFLQNKSRLTSLENELMVHEEKGIIREFRLTYGNERKG